MSFAVSKFSANVARRVLVGGLLSALAASAANAGVVFSFQQVGADVVLTGSGSYNLTGARALGTGSQDGFVASSGASLAVGGPFGSITAYFLTASEGAFGTGGFVEGFPDVGDRFGLGSGIGLGYITIYSGYVSGTALSGSTTFRNRTLASLGLTAGTTRNYRIPNDFVTVNVANAVPEPASLALVALGLGAGALVRRRRQAA